MASDFDVMVEINGDDSGLSKALKSATNNIAQFGYTLNGKITEGLVDPTKKAKVEFKDVARIVAGIVISKTFYTSLNAIRNATDAVKEFNVELEYTKTAFSNLFNSADLASEFINVLKDFSAVSPFGFTDSSKAAQQLLAYGIQYKNVMYVMQGVMDAATMMGDPAKIESISRALGQIYTKGTLKGEELRQLAEAGIPAYEILQEKLGLTSEAMRDIGNQAIPASTAINALVDGINERFSGMTKASAKTMKGMVSNIKDNMLMIMSGALTPLYEQMRTITHHVDLLVNKLREVYDLKGLGGVFEYLVPDKQIQADLRQFIAIIQEIWHVLSYGLQNSLVVIRSLLLGLVRIINIIGPTLINVAQVIALVMRELSKCEPLMKALAYLLAFNTGAWLAFKAAALGARILAPITQIILNCAKALSILGALVVAHPLTAGLILLTGAVVALGLAHSKAGEQIRKFFNELTAWNGIDPGKQLLPETKKRTADLDKFNEKLDGTADALDKTGDEAEKAAKKGKKAQKDLLSFDEVFRLMQPDETDNDGDIETPGWEMPDIDADFDPLDMSGIIPDFADLAIFDFDAQLTKLKDKIKELWDKFVSEIPGVLAGAGLGALIGGLIGGPLGAVLGAAAGALVGHFWDEFANLIGINNKQHAAIAGALLGGFMALIAYLTGLPAIAVALAGLAGFFGGLLWEKIAEAFGLEGAKKKEAAIASGIGAAFGAILGGLIGGPLGAVIGAFIGTFAGEFWSIIADKLGLTTGAKFAGLIGAGIVAVLELAVKHASPLAALGAAALAASWITALVQGFQTGDWSQLLTVFTSTLGRLAYGPLGSIIGKVVATAYNITYKQLQDHFGISNAYKFNDVILAGINAALMGIPAFVTSIASQIATTGAASLTSALKSGAKAGFIGFVASLASSAVSNLLIDWLANEFNLTKEDVEAGKTFGEIGGLIGAIIGTFFGPLGTAIGTAIGTIGGSIIGAFAGQDIIGWFHGWWDPFAANAIQVITTFFTQTIPNAWNALVSFVTGIPGAIAGFFSGIANAVVTFFTQTIPNAWNSFVGLLGSIATSIGEFFTMITSDLAYWIGYGLGTIAKGFYNIGQAVVTFFTQTLPNAWNDFVSWLSTLPDALAQWFEGVQEWFNGVVQDVEEVLVTIRDTVTTFFTETLPSAWDQFLGWLSGVGQNLSELFNSAVQHVQQFFMTIVGAVYIFFTEILPNAWNDFVNWLGTLPEAISTWFNGLLTTVQTFFGNVYNAITTFFTQTLPTAWNNFLTWLSSLPAAISTWFTNLINQFTTWGAALVQGLIDGFMSIWNGIGEWINGIVTSFTQGFQDGWDMHSPSVVFYNIGVNLVQGLLNGISDLWVTLTEVVGGFITGLVDTFTTGFGNITTAIGEWATNAATSISTFATDTAANVTTWVSDRINDFTTWATNTGNSISGWASNTAGNISNWATTTGNNFVNWATGAGNNIASFASNAAGQISGFGSNAISNISSFASNAASNVSSFVSDAGSQISSFASNAGSALSSFTSSAGSVLSNFAASFKSSIASAVSFAGTQIHNFVASAGAALSSWASSALSKIASVVARAVAAASRVRGLPRHASGGVFNREHIARVAEGGKAEAIIPLENKQAMQPFVDAVASGLSQYLGPIANMQQANSRQLTPAYAGASDQSALPPLYVGTLIADDRSLRELERRMQVIRLSESNRRAHG